MNEIRFIAYYLPQYHPILENDEWWGKGFTEWTNVTKAKPLFKGHYQPRYPADLGYYDLRVAEVREQQAAMAKAYGVHGFCYYHYWFGNGKKLLERPFEEVLSSGKPDFPFMLCWANQTWKGVWFGASKGNILIEQTYPGKQDYIDHFNYIISAFKDPRYIRIDDKPVFQVYRPLEIPDLNLFVETFRTCAEDAGLKGLYLMACGCNDDWDPKKNGFDGVVSNRFEILRFQNNRFESTERKYLSKIERKIKLFINYYNFEVRKSPFKVRYKKIINKISKWPKVKHDYFPLIIPDWDNTARTGNRSYLLTGSKPELWKAHIKSACEYIQYNDPDKQIVFIKSWNEWAEGNYLEPDQTWGYAYLEALHNVKLQFDKEDI